MGGSGNVLGLTHSTSLYVYKRRTNREFVFLSVCVAGNNIHPVALNDLLKVIMVATLCGLSICIKLHAYKADNFWLISVSTRQKRMKI